MATIPSIALIPSGVKAGKVYSVLPTDGSGDFTFTRVGALPSYNATRVNSDGLIEQVLSNVPRLDYTGGGCPSLLLEPQRTNFLTYSEQFDNAAWTKSNATITANATTAPDGTTTADLLVCNTSNVGSNFVRQYKIITDTVHTLSFYAKANLSSIIRIAEASYTGQQLDFDLSNNTISGSGSQVNGTIVNSINGWKKITFTYIYTTGQTDCYLNINSTNAYVWGAQLELGSYATSYIPTTSASVTRVAETASKTGLSSYIGQTEGVFYAEINPVHKGVNSMIQISNGTNFNALYFLSNGNTSIRVGVTTFQTSYFKDLTITENENIKIAIKYKVGEYPKAFLNGILHNIPFTSGVNAPAVEFIFDRLNLSYWWSGFPFKGKIKNLQVYNTALSDAELISLTSN